MAALEKIPALKEIKEKGALAVLEERFPVIKRVRARSSGGGGSPQIPTLNEFKEKGVLRVLEERFPKVKEIREGGILAGGILAGVTKPKAPAAAPAAPAVPAPTLYPAAPEAPVKVDLMMKPRLY